MTSAASQQFFETFPPDVARCSVRGCDRKPEWVNEHGEWPLCSVHYNELSLRAKREVRP